MALIGMKNRVLNPDTAAVEVKENVNAPRVRAGANIRDFEPR